MLKKLNQQQRNNLLIGNQLAVELESRRGGFKVFIVIGVHGERTLRQSKYLNQVENDDLLYWFKRFEIEECYLKGWDADLHVLNEIFIKHLQLAELESKLGEYLSNFETLSPSWNWDLP